MRGAALVALIVLLAGCSGAEPSSAPPSDDFEDFEVEATDTKGVLLGVVVDEAIRPIAEAKVTINLADGTPSVKTTNDEGRFAYGDLDPGTYLIQVSHLQYTSAQSSADVAAGDKDPKINRIQISRLFDQEPFTEMIVFEGYLQCAYAIGVSSTCVNDYTRVAGCLNPSACVCPGGCFRDHELAKKGLNIREYVSVIGPGWQSIIFETTWEPTSETGKELGFTVSFYSRPDATHRYGGAGGPAPLRLQLDTGVEDDGAAKGAADHTIVPENGTEELFVFYSAGDLVVVNQQFRAFQTAFYYGIPPEGWAFINGDQPPY